MLDRFSEAFYEYFNEGLPFSDVRVNAQNETSIITIKNRPNREITT